MDFRSPLFPAGQRAGFPPAPEIFFKQETFFRSNGKERQLAAPPFRIANKKSYLCSQKKQTIQIT